jgi:hypothetical protein
VIFPESVVMDTRFIFLVVLAVLVTSGPLHAGINIDGPLTQERVVRPGDAHSGLIAVSNTGAEPVEVKVYRADYSFSADGRNDYGDPGALERSNAHWMRLNQEQVTIPPKRVVNIHYALQVPADETLSGTYWSMVMVEPVAAQERVTAPRTNELRAQLTPVLRYGIQVVTHIGDSGARELAFTNPQLREEHGQRMFTVDVANTGERWLRPQLWLELYEASGLKAGRLSGKRQRIYPSTSVRYRIELGDLPAGRYRALIVADAGGDDLFGTQIELTIK